MARIEEYCCADAEPRLTFRMAYKLKILAPTDYAEARRVTTTAKGTAFQTFKNTWCPLPHTMVEVCKKTEDGTCLPKIIGT